MCGCGDRMSLKNQIAGILEVRLRQGAGETCRNEIHHDRVDHFVRAEPGFQNAGNSGPYRSGKDRRGACKRNEHPRREIREREADPCRGQCRNRELAFCADVEQAAAETDCDRQTGEDQGSSVEQGVANTVRPGQGASDEQTIRVYRIVPNEQDDDPAGDERCEHRDQRKREMPEIFHARPPVIINPI